MLLWTLERACFTEVLNSQLFYCSAGRGRGAYPFSAQGILTPAKISLLRQQCQVAPHNHS